MPSILSHCQFSLFFCPPKRNGFIARRPLLLLQEGSGKSGSPEKRKLWHPLNLVQPKRYLGGSVPRYAEIEMMSSSESFATGFFISSTALPALDPF